MPSAVLAYIQSKWLNVTFCTTALGSRTKFSEWNLNLLATWKGRFDQGLVSQNKTQLQPKFKWIFISKWILHVASLLWLQFPRPHVNAANIYAKNPLIWKTAKRGMTGSYKSTNLFEDIKTFLKAGCLQSPDPDVRKLIKNIHVSISAMHFPHSLNFWTCCQTFLYDLSPDEAPKDVDDFNSTTSPADINYIKKKRSSNFSLSLSLFFNLQVHWYGLLSFLNFMWVKMTSTKWT